MEKYLPSLWALLILGTPAAVSAAEMLTASQVQTYMSASSNLYEEAGCDWLESYNEYFEENSVRYQLDDTHNLIRISCSLYAYSEISLWMFEDKDSKISPIYFSEPYVDIDAEDISGMQTRFYLYDAKFDPDLGVLESYTRWRGMNDAYSASTWNLKKDELDGNFFFVLTQFEADTKFDGVGETNVEWKAPD